MIFVLIDAKSDACPPLFGEIIVGLAIKYGLHGPLE
jgi:hypothetical protein